MCTAHSTYTKINVPKPLRTSDSYTCTFQQCLYEVPKPKLNPAEEQESGTAPPGGVRAKSGSPQHLRQQDEEDGLSLFNNEQGRVRGALIYSPEYCQSCAHIHTHTQGWGGSVEHWHHFPSWSFWISILVKFPSSPPLLLHLTYIPSDFRVLTDTFFNAIKAHL